jgi:hypothetical protein
MDVADQQLQSLLQLIVALPRNLRQQGLGRF